MLREDPPNAASGIVTVSRISWNEMDMKMTHCLSSRGPVIDTDVVTIRIKLGVKCSLGGIERGKQSNTLGLRRAEQRRYMALGDDQRVPGRDRKSVPDNEYEIIFGHEPLGREFAERAVRNHVSHFIDWGLP